MARLPDPHRSRVLLIGTSTYDDPMLPQHLAVRNNLEELQAVLTHPEFGGLPRAHCRVLRDPKDPNMICDALDEAAAQAEDLLLIYYAGHGLLDENSRLFLAASGTRRQRLHYTALDVADIKKAFQHTPAKNRVLILDSCFSGRAIEQAMGDEVAVSVLDASLDGAYFLTSVPANQKGFAPPGDRYTSFTGALLDLLRSGLPGGPPLLPLRLIHETLIRRLPERGQPSPQQANTSTVADLALVRNRATVSPAAVTGPKMDGRSATVDDERSSSKAVSFTQKRGYIDLRRLLISVIVIGGLAIFSWRAPYSGSSAEQISLSEFVVVLLATLIPILVVSAAFPRTYALTFTHDGVELVVGRRIFFYPWVSVAQIRLVRRPAKNRRRRGSLVLLLRLQPNVSPPSAHRGAPTPRLMEESAMLSFVNVRRLDTRPEQIEQALERFAKAAWAPMPEITVPEAAQLAMSKPQASRFASRRPRLVLLAACMLVVGLSPMGILSELGRIDLPVWRITAITAWSLLLCAPAVAVFLLVLHPAVLCIDGQGLVFARNRRTISYAWQDLEHIAVLTARQTGIWFPILFLRPRYHSELPPNTGGWWHLPRYSTWLRGVILCDLFSLTTSRKALEEALARFAGDTWTATFQPEGGLDDRTTRVGIGGQVVGLRNVLGFGLCLFVAVPVLEQILVPAVIPHPGLLVVALGQTIAAAGLLAAFLVALHVRAPCKLILDPHQIVVTVRGRSVTIPWHQISYIRLVHTETTTAQVGGGQMITRKDDILLYLREDIRTLRGRWLLWPCCQKKYGGLVLTPITHPFLRWFVSAETMDRSMARFAGSRYLPRSNHHIALTPTKK
jgi:hypothetical protein